MQTQLLLQMDHSTELSEEITKNGPVTLATQPPTAITKPDVKHVGNWLTSVFQPNFLKDALRALNESVALSSTYDPAAVSSAGVRQALEHTNLLFQLVSPEDCFRKIGLNSTLLRR
jgi:hypothetical protein